MAENRRSRSRLLAACMVIILVGQVPSNADYCASNGSNVTLEIVDGEDACPFDSITVRCVVRSSAQFLAWRCNGNTRNVLCIMNDRVVNLNCEFGKVFNISRECPCGGDDVIVSEAQFQANRLGPKTLFCENGMDVEEISLAPKDLQTPMVTYEKLSEEEKGQVRIKLMWTTPNSAMNDITYHLTIENSSYSNTWVIKQTHQDVTVYTGRNYTVAVFAERCNGTVRSLNGTIPVSLDQAIPTMTPTLKHTTDGTTGGGLGPGPIVGIVLAVVIVAILVIAVPFLVLFCYRRGKKKVSKPVEQKYEEDTQTEIPVYPGSHKIRRPTIPNTTTRLPEEANDNGDIAANLVTFRELSEKERQCESYTTIIAEKDAVIETMGGKMELLEARIQKLEGERNAKEELEGLLRDERNAKEKLENLLRDEKKEKEDMKATLMAELKAVTEECNKAKSERDILLQVRETLEQEISELKSKHNEAMKMHSQAMKMHDEMTKMYSETTKMHSEAIKELIELKEVSHQRQKDNTRRMEYTSHAYDSGATGYSEVADDSGVIDDSGAADLHDYPAPESCSQSYDHHSGFN